MLTKREIIDYCLTYQDSFEDYPFEEDNWAAIRHKSNAKTFAFIYEKDGQICLNLKCEPMKAEFLRSAFEAVIPAYHMNKTHWNTVFLNKINENEVYEMIKNSFELTMPKKNIKN